MISRNLVQAHLISWANLLRKQVVKLRLPILTSLVIGLLGIGGIYALSILTRTPLSDLTRDIQAIAQVDAHTGLLSNIGLLLWSATTAICFFGARLLSRYPHTQRTVLFLFSSALISLMMTTDDAFMLHEEVFPSLLLLSEKKVYFIYFILITGYLIYFLPDLLQTDYLLLVIAFAFFGGSILIDELLPYANLETFIEDSLKFCGIIFWLTYYARTTVFAINHNLTTEVESGNKIAAIQ